MIERPWDNTGEVFIRDDGKGDGGVLKLKYPQGTVPHDPGKSKYEGEIDIAMRKQKLMRQGKEVSAN